MNYRQHDILSVLQSFCAHPLKTQAFAYHNAIISLKKISILPSSHLNHNWSCSYVPKPPPVHQKKIFLPLACSNRTQTTCTTDILGCYVAWASSTPEKLVPFYLCHWLGGQVSLSSVTYRNYNPTVITALSNERTNQGENQVSSCSQGSRSTCWWYRVIGFKHEICFHPKTMLFLPLCPCERRSRY